MAENVEYRGWFGQRARRRCPHSRMVGIYGDPINHNGGWRLACLQCGGLIDGPVALARHRMDERDLFTPTPPADLAAAAETKGA